MILFKDNKVYFCKPAGLLSRPPILNHPHDQEPYNCFKHYFYGKLLKH